MKAAVYDRNSEQGVAVVEKEPLLERKARSGTALVRVVAAGLNPVDAKFQVGDKFSDSLETPLRRFMDGRGVGFDLAGVVLDAPPDAPFGMGDLVYGAVPPLTGSVAQVVEVPLHQLARKPKSLTFAQAAALPLVGLTAYQSLHVDYNLTHGQHLLLLGASGGVGHVALQVAKCLGAKVTAVCSGKNAALVRELGADTVIDYGAGDVMAALADVAAKQGLFDLCLDCVTSHDARDTTFSYERSILAAQPAMLRGTYVTIGGYTSEWFCALMKRTVGVNLFKWWTPGKELFWIRFPHSSAALSALAAWVDEGKLKPLVGRDLLPLTDEGMQTGFRELHSRRVVGKLVVQVSAEANEKQV